jgi:hypothetical protein
VLASPDGRNGASERLRRDEQNTALNDWIIDSEPINATGTAAASGDTPVGWSTRMHGDSTQGNKQIIAYAICASP